MSSVSGSRVRTEASSTTVSSAPMGSPGVETRCPGESFGSKMPRACLLGEANRGRGGAIGGRGLEVIVVIGHVAEAGYDVVGEGADVGVVVLNGEVVLAAGDGDAVFGAGQLVLQRQKVLVAAQLRVIFHHHQQAAERAIELVIGRHGLLRRAGSAQGGAGAGDL